jgi:hypothetical protein
MKRRHGALVFVLALAASCVTESPTGQVEQAVKDCTPGGNFPNATLPAQPQWVPGVTIPPTGDKEGWVIWRESTNGDWNALLANPSSGTITAAFKLKDADVPDSMKIVGPRGRIDVGHLPPPPPPTGTGRMARYALELELRAAQLHVMAMDASL